MPKKDWLHDAPHNNMNNFQHSSMYFAFVVSGMVDLAQRWGWFPLEMKSVGHIGLCMAFFVEGSLFAGHPKPSHLETFTHTVIAYATWAQIAILLLELWKPHMIMLSYLKSWPLIIHGVWFYVVGYIMYIGKFPDTHSAYAMATMIAVWAIMLAFMFVVVASAGIHFTLSRYTCCTQFFAFIIDPVTTPAWLRTPKTRPGVVGADDVDDVYDDDDEEDISDGTRLINNRSGTSSSLRGGRSDQQRYAMIPQAHAEIEMSSQS